MFSSQSGGWEIQTVASHPDAEARAKTDEALCVGNLRTLNTAQSSYRGGDPQKGYARTLKLLGPKGEDIIDSTLASGSTGGYKFLLKPGRLEKGVVKHYVISARPLKILIKGQRSFMTDETGVIRFTEENRPATTSDSPIQ
jgi:hypothetical protein